MIAIIDYGVGNLFSLKSSFEKIGKETIVTKDREEIRMASHIILPGVGAFGEASKKLFESGMADVIKEEASLGKPIMGICLGMQLLFDKGFEFGEFEGLGLVHGSVVSIEPFIKKGNKIPQIGWNSLHFTGEKSPIFKYIKEGDFVYFVHSYHGSNCKDFTIATTDYDGILTAAVANKNVFGCQFHPEKSGDVGLNILKAFTEV